MPFKVASWNAQDGLAKPNKANAIIEEVKRIDADVMVFPEGYAQRALEHAAGSERLEESVQQLGTLGYEVSLSLYEDKNDRADRHGMVYVSRLGGCAGFEYFGERKSAHGIVQDPATGILVEVWGLHLDDRSKHIRIDAINAALPDYVVGTIFAGDFNATPDTTYREHALGCSAVRALASRLPSARWKSVTTRLSDMVSGEEIRVLMHKGLHDAGREPTWPSVFPTVQLDHIMASDDIRAGKFEVGSRSQVGLSDHRSVSAVIHT